MFLPNQIDAFALFSEGAAYNRIFVARAARRLPGILEALASGAVHLAGLRILVPHLTEENHDELLAEAAGRSKREIEEIAARLAPKPPVPDSIRKLPQRIAVKAAPGSATAPRSSRPDAHRPVVAPLSAETYEFKFTGSREVREKVRKAQDLLRHRLPSGDLAVVFEKALDALIANLMKDRFAVGRKPRGQVVPIFSASPDIPDPIKRAVFERDGRCTFVSEDGRRCHETGGLEFDHLDGWAQTNVHDVDRIRLVCRAHNQHAADQLYGRVLMERLRESRREAKAAREAPTITPESPTCPGASCQQSLV